MPQFMVHNTNGSDNVERASLAFVVANVAASSEQETVVLLTIEGVRIPTKGFTEGLQAEGFPPLSELVQNFVSVGGEIWVCGACAKPRGITEEDLISGAKIIGAAAAVEALVNGAKAIDF